MSKKNISKKVKNTKLPEAKKVDQQQVQTANTVPTEDKTKQGSSEIEVMIPTQLSSYIVPVTILLTALVITASIIYVGTIIK